GFSLCCQFVRLGLGISFSRHGICFFSRQLCCQFVRLGLVALEALRADSACVALGASITLVTFVTGVTPGACVAFVALCAGITLKALNTRIALVAHQALRAGVAFFIHLAFGLEYQNIDILIFVPEG